MMERNPKRKTGLEGTAWIRSRIDAIHWISFSTVLHAYILRAEGLFKWWGRGQYSILNSWLLHRMASFSLIILIVADTSLIRTLVTVTSVALYSVSNHHVVISRIMIT